jgi:hypothetical protein
MALVAPNEGEAILLDRMLNGWTYAADKLILFTNNATLSEATVYTDLTQPVGGSYTATTLNAVAGWGVSDGTATYDGGSAVTITFSADLVNGPWTIYGYAVVNNASTEILWVEKFTGGPFIIANSGGSTSIVLRITLD